MKDTSLQAYAALDTSTSKRIILQTVNRRRRGMTRRQIEEATGMRSCQVSGRVNELIKAGVLAETTKAPCPVSGRTAWVVEVVR